MAKIKSAALLGDVWRNQKIHAKAWGIDYNQPTIGLDREFLHSFKHKEKIELSSFAPEAEIETNA
jgi:hypothetical protein